MLSRDPDFWGTKRFFDKTSHDETKKFKIK